MSQIINVCDNKLLCIVIRYQQITGLGKKKTLINFDIIFHELTS